MCNEPKFLQERLSEIIADVSTNESFDEEYFQENHTKVFINEFYNFYNFLSPPLYIKNFKGKSLDIKTGCREYFRRKIEKIILNKVYLSKYLFCFSGLLF